MNENTLTFTKTTLTALLTQTTADLTAPSHCESRFSSVLDQCDSAAAASRSNCRWRSLESFRWFRTCLSFAPRCFELKAAPQATDTQPALKNSREHRVHPKEYVRRERPADVVDQPFLGGFDDTNPDWPRSQIPQFLNSKRPFFKGFNAFF